ncbi:protocatechuate dioxygenase [Oceanicella sp. SM1341]|uniref:dioxygenase family protein n=1 Tax=Oceanicella sp. SM1341 TaxID=1548889 RepID=UPI000E536297|nr:protocatechuate dioxygenase [Oceanicella sp. SM1341]
MTDLSRRALLAGLALTPVTGLLRPARAADTGPACRPTPQTPEGPFYSDARLVREDITEGRAGLPLTLVLELRDTGCAPLAGARTDVWHCDATGGYSGADGGPATFLRGTGFADAQGLVRFRTIYPGWSRGRTTHVHYKVFLGGACALTSQLFFPDAVSETIYAGQQPYAARAARRDTFNASDPLRPALGDAVTAELEHGAQGITARLSVVVARPMPGRAGFASAPQPV